MKRKNNDATDKKESRADVLADIYELILSWPQQPARDEKLAEEQPAGDEEE